MTDLCDPSVVVSCDLLIVRDSEKQSDSIVRVVIIWGEVLTF